MFDFTRKIRLYGFSKSLKFIIYELHNILWMRLVQHSYSQQGEDIVIDALLGNKKSGFYVDVGAHDPVRFSNTKRFYNRGWRGINIDPNPLLMKNFEHSRKRDINLTLGVGKKNEQLIFYEFFPSTISTLSVKAVKTYQKEGFLLIGKKQVFVRKLEFILNKYCQGKRIDLLTIDAEGTDLEVLESNNWRKYKPRVICIETNKNDKVSGFLKKHGYKLKIDNGLNSIFFVS